MPATTRRSLRARRAPAFKRASAKKTVARKKKASSTTTKRRVIRLKSRVVKRAASKKTATKRKAAPKRRVATKKMAAKRKTPAKKMAAKRMTTAKKRVAVKKKAPVKENFMNSKTLTPMAMVFVKFKRGAPQRVMKAYMKNKHIHEAWSWSGEWDCGYLFDVNRSSELRDVLNKTLRKSTWVSKIKTKWIEKCW